MTAIICTTIICATVLFGLHQVLQVFQIQKNSAQQITDEDLAKAYQEADRDKVPDFQDVIAFINREFSGLEEEHNEEE